MFMQSHRTRPQAVAPTASGIGPNGYGRSGTSVWKYCKGQNPSHKDRKANMAQVVLLSGRTANVIQCLLGLTWHRLQELLSERTAKDIQFGPCRS